MVSDGKKKNSKQSFSNNNALRLPKREDILAFIKNNPDKSGKREIAKAFNLKAEARIWLKDILRNLADDGLVEKRRKNIVAQGSLPPVSMIEIYARDKDGGFLAKPLEWGNTPHPIIEIHPARVTKTPALGIGDRILAKIFRNKSENGPAYTGKLIRKMDKTEKTTIGVLRQIESGEWRLEPIDRKSPELIIESAEGMIAKAGDLIEVEIGRDSRYGLKRGKVKNVLGKIDSEKALSMIAIISQGIPYIFPQSVIEESEQAKLATMNNREDWRDLPLITIDPHDAKDHDDAVFAKPDDAQDNLGGTIVTVAIADVALYIQPRSDLDKEALKRGNSVYFPDRVVPMLPERISNNLCSLRENEDRPALAVRMVFDADGKKRRHSFHRIMMRSHAKLSYQQAQSAIDGNVDEKTAPLLENVLKPLWDAYAILKAGRNKREPLELDLPEKKIILDKEGRVKDVLVPPRLDAHRLIEECMIQANVAAAETLKNHHQALIFRIHDQPSLAKQESLRNFLHTLGMSLAKGAELTPGRMNGILAKVEGTEQQELVNQVVLRSQSQAEYNPENIGHFGLHLKNYAHFTSPIRRYADLIVHRALIKALKFGDDGLTSDEEANLSEISTLISSSERRAMAGERDTVDRLIAHYLADKIGVAFHGRIAGVTKSGLFVSLDKLGADGFIPISTLHNDYYHFDEARHSLSGEKSRKGYQLGDRVEVKLIEALPIAGALRFQMVSPARALPFSPVSHHKSSRIAKKNNYTAKNRRGR